jgi:glycosyltransferase involved in cell wall biosynthesis
MKIALLSTDNREHLKDYHNSCPYFGAAPEALLQGFALLPEVEVHVVSCVRKSVTAPEKLADNIWYNALTVPKSGWMTTGYQGCIRAVRSKLKEINPDIVHGQGTERDCCMGAVFSGYPNVITIHGNMAELARLQGARPFSFGWLAARLEGLVLSRTAGVFCNSTYTYNLVAPRSKKTWRVDNPIRQQFFRACTQRKRDGVIRFVNVGVVSERKRQMELLEVFRHLHVSGVPVRVDFIGEANPQSPYANRFLKAIEGAGGYASYVGPLGLDDLIRRMDEVEAMVHFPSEEAFGLVVAEALARNLRFFGASVGGIKDISSGVSGAELFAEDDFSALEMGIKGWIDAGAPQAEGDNLMMHQRYHPQVIAERHIEIYREVLGR